MLRLSVIGHKARQSSCYDWGYMNITTDSTIKSSASVPVPSRQPGNKTKASIECIVVEQGGRVAAAGTLVTALHLAPNLTFPRPRAPQLRGGILRHSGPRLHSDLVYTATIQMDLHLEYKADQLL